MVVFVIVNGKDKYYVVEEIMYMAEWNLLIKKNIPAIDISFLKYSGSNQFLVWNQNQVRTMENDILQINTTGTAYIVWLTKDNSCYINLLFGLFQRQSCKVM